VCELTSLLKVIVLQNVFGGERYEYTQGQMVYSGKWVKTESSLPKGEYREFVNCCGWKRVLSCKLWKNRSGENWASPRGAKSLWNQHKQGFGGALERVFRVEEKTIDISDVDENKEPRYWQIPYETRLGWKGCSSNECNGDVTSTMLDGDRRQQFRQNRRMA